MSGDQTEILRAGYWPSYNVPFYEQVVHYYSHSSAFDVKISSSLSGATTLHYRETWNACAWCCIACATDDSKLWLSPSAKQRWNPCSGSPPVCQDLNTYHDWPVKKSRCLFANQIERKFETSFRYFVESVVGPEQGGSPKGFFNPVIPTRNSSQSCNPEGYFWHPTSRAYFQSRISPRFCFQIPNPELQIREISDPGKPIGDPQQGSRRCLADVTSRG